MAKLRITTLPDDKPVKVSVELPAAVHRDLLAYSELVSHQSGQPASDLGKLVTAMVARFMATDRAFAKLRKNRE
ncbi:MULTISPECIES: DUF2274 domain-containing protein [unclassified Bradyrhizobium]|uniref:DUF2274 domain-containing protein n=1 Tax=unclassified Bradyrhizobium TaxID=2631580 RepID=UPI0028EDD117|nr:MULTISPECIES: DUF2274 domain-containing protein [unclassified Bradyrhizobium]